MNDGHLDKAGCLPCWCAVIFMLAALCNRFWPIKAGRRLARSPPSRKTIDVRLLRWTDPGLYRPKPIAQGCQHEDSSTPTRQASSFIQMSIMPSGGVRVWKDCRRLRKSEHQKAIFENGSPRGRRAENGLPGGVARPSDHQEGFNPRRLTAFKRRSNCVP